MTTGMAGDVVIAGGYGQVGRAAARRLVTALPGRVVIAGRDGARAASLARELGHEARGRALDLRAPAAELAATLAGARVVVACSDAGGRAFAEACLGSGVHYVDVTADETALADLESLDGIARAAGATGVVHVGLAPGLTNLLAARAVALVDGATRADLFVLLGLGEKHGDSAIDWTLDNLARPFTVVADGAPRVVSPFREGARFLLPGEQRPRWAYRFNFPDQRAVARDLALPSASTWLCFDSRAVTTLLWLCARIGLLALLRRPLVWALVRALLGHPVLGEDAFAVVARASGPAGARSVALTGRREADITGVVAAAVALHLLADAPPGVHAIGRVLTLDELAPALGEAGCRVTDVEEPSSAAAGSTAWR
jgi:saccharopine dehydrogenase (NAD+, L-lysine-forming)